MYKLYQGDCLEVMNNLIHQGIKVNAIITDLPFEVTSCEWDLKLPVDKMWDLYKNIIKDNSNIVLFAVLPFGIDLIQSNKKWFKYDLVWSKNVPTGMSYAKRPMRYHENILVFSNGNSTYNPIPKKREGKGKDCYKYDHYCGSSHHIQLNKIKKKYDLDYVNPSTILNFNVVPNRKGKLHPTQKPVPLMEYLIKTYTNEGDLILDNCMGSGSTGVACVNTNRNFIGIELDKKYFEIAEKRIKEAKETIFDVI